MQLKINEVWLKGLKAEERDKMKKIVTDSTILLDKLKEILYNRQEEKRKTVLGDYDSPSWSHKQAHLNGELESLQMVINLITVTERDDPSRI